MLKEIAYCGLICSECPAYIAKRTDNQAIREKTALEWSKGNLKVSPKQINCDGCHNNENIFIYCENCTIRHCGLKNEIATCADCDDFPCRDKLAYFWNHFNLSQAKTTLENLRNSTV